LQPLRMSVEDRPAKLALTPEEVLGLLRDTTPETLIGLTEKMGATYSGEPLNPSETMMAEQIFRLLMRDTELRVRMTLAQHVKESTNIPRDIVMSLAHDVEEVSLPMLQYSQVLTDEDLVDLIHNTDEISRYLAISKRPQVSGMVSDTLLSKGNDEVAATLVDNSGAEISERGYARIVDQYKSNVILMESLSQRPRLPVSAVEKLVHIVSSSLGETLKKKYKLPTEQIEKEVEKTREGETLELIRGSASQEEIDKLINQLISFGRLTPSIILSALCQGDFAFFETSLARLSNISVANARTLISDRGELGFRAIYNKSGLSDAMFPAVKLLLKVVRELDEAGEKPGSSRYPNRIVERILQYSEGSEIENLSYIIALVRRVAQ